jgi:predicted DNA binding CopG/RHH family protein
MRYKHCSIRLRNEQISFLRAEAAKRSMNISEYIRYVIDREIDKH